MGKFQNVYSYRFDFLNYEKHKKNLNDNYEVGKLSLKLHCMHVDNKDWLDVRSTTPDDVIRIGDVVPKTAEKLTVSDLLYCGLGDVYNLSSFWVCDLRAEFQLVSQLRSFYLKAPLNYNLSPSSVEKGLYCVAAYFDDFLRCFIIDVLYNAGFVMVFFIDRGFVDCVSIRSLYHLNKKIAQFPAIAIQVRLANIVPKNKFWRPNALKKFDECLQNLNFHVKVVAMDKNMIFDVLVKKSSGRYSDEYVNDTLVNCGYAVKKCKKVTEVKEAHDRISCW